MKWHKITKDDLSYQYTLEKFKIQGECDENYPVYYAQYGKGKMLFTMYVYYTGNIWMAVFRFADKKIYMQAYNHQKCLRWNEKIFDELLQTVKKSIDM